MSLDDRTRTRTLRRGELLRCADERPTWLSVLRGRVWVTRAGDLDDHFLEAGQSIRLEAGSRALASAEGGPAQLVLVEQERATIEAQPELLPDP